MDAVKMNIDVQRGKTFRLEFDYYFADETDLDANGKPIEKPVDLTGSVLRFRCQWGRDPGDLLEVLTTDTVPDPGFEFPAPDATGAILLKLSPTQTETMKKNTGARYELDRLVGGDVEPIVYGDVNITDWITND